VGRRRIAAHSYVGQGDLRGGPAEGDVQSLAVAHVVELGQLVEPVLLILRRELAEARLAL
jgi:hypothetical protein